MDFKQDMNSSEKVFRDFLAGDFWKFIYVSRNVLMRSAHFSDNVYADLEVLSEYIDDEYYTLRCALNAEFRRLNGLEFSYDLNAMGCHEVGAVRRLLCGACLCGYYPWDIVSACSAGEILSFYMKCGGVPLPPRPFGNSHEQQARAVTFNLVVGALYTGSSESSDRYAKEKIRYVVEATPEAEVDVELKKIEFFREANSHIAKMMRDGDPRSRNEIVVFLQKRKRVVPDSFSAKSNAARCVGLIMYEEMAKNDFACKDYIPTFKKTETYSKLSQTKIFKDSANPYLSDKEDITLKRWLQNTEKSILNMSVGSFK